LKTDIHTAHEFRGDLYREGEERADLLKRIKAHLAETFPGMKATMRFGGDWYHSSLTVSILGYSTADLSVREEGSAARRLIDAELKRFTRHDWEPHYGLRNVSLYTSTQIDPSLHAAALQDAPSLQPRLSFAEFTRQARPGDVLEHIAGVLPHQGARVEIVAISSRRLTTRAADGAENGDARRTPIQGGACFQSDGETVCFRHSGFASVGGYSHMRWLRAA
jgi:hypothetical protein